MHGTQEHAEALERTKRVISVICSLKPDELIRQEELQHFNFGKARVLIDETIRLYSRLQTTALSSLPVFALKNLEESGRVSLSALRALLSFTPNPPQSASDRHHGLVRQLEAAYESAFSIICSITGFLASQDTQLEEIKSKLDHMFSEFEATKVELSAANHANQIREEAFRALVEKESKSFRVLTEEMRQNALNDGVSKQSKHFKATADAHDKEAKAWFWRIAGFSILLCCFAVFSLFFNKFQSLTPQNTYETVQLTVSKILVFTTIASAMYISVRNYAASRHNSIVNRHRQDALSTFHSLVEAGSEPAKRDIVLVKAAECIFDQQPTGFGKTDGADNSSVSLISVPLAAAKSMGSGEPR